MSKSSELTDVSEEDSITVNIPPEIDTDEEELFREKAILFRFNKEKTEWVSRGSGTVKILKDKEGHVRILMRQNQTYVVRMNHLIPYTGTLHTLGTSNREFSWTAFDFSDEQEVRYLFAIRFALPTIADSFKAQFEIGQNANREIMEKKGTA